MAYRKITVDGVVHEYVVGKTHVKIKGREAIPIDKIGASVTMGEGKKQRVVTPARIASYIKHGYVIPEVKQPETFVEMKTAEMRRVEAEGHKTGDFDRCHGRADHILCEVLRHAGHNELVDAWQKVPKWYA